MKVRRSGFKGAKSQHGWDIIQLSIVIAIIAMLTVLSLVMVKSTRTSGTAQAAAGTFSAIAQGTRKAGSAAVSYSGFSATTLIDQGVIPEKWVSGTTILDDWGQSVTVAVTTLSGGTSNAVMFTFPAVPSAACSDFVNQASGAAEVISVAGTSVKNVTSGTNTVSPSTLATACDANSGSTKSVAFTVGR